MKAIIIIMLFISSSICCIAQNVGIGNTNPAEKLDVNGNINVTGTIKANGIDGAPNQVLMKNSGGVLQWSDLAAYKNFTAYYSDGSFTVPAGVTKIAVELWGAGGGGNYDAGGGGGAYLYAVLDVLPGTIGTIDVGTGGAGVNALSAVSGGPTKFDISSISLNASGGGGASFISATNSIAGSGGFFPAFIAGINSFIGVRGVPGFPAKRNFQQFSATAFYETTDGGNGGWAYNGSESAGQGGRIVFNVTGSTTIQFIAGNIDGHAPGGGGASGIHFAGGSTAGGFGGDGLVIVHY